MDVVLRVEPLAPSWSPQAIVYLRGKRYKNDNQNMHMANEIQLSVDVGTPQGQSTAELPASASSWF